MKIPAKAQKKYIDKMVDGYTQSRAVKPEKPISSVRYIDIIDEGQRGQDAAKSRIKMAVQRAKDAMPSTVTKITPKSQQTVTAGSIQMNANFVDNLQTEIASLKKVIADLKGSPTPALKLSQYGLPSEVLPTFDRLISSGIAEDVVVQLLKSAVSGLPAQRLKTKAIVDGWCAREILQGTKTVSHQDTKIQIFLGPAGSGKTACLIKYAANLVIKHKKNIAIVTTDNRKVGAVDQLRTYAQILNVPFATIKQGTDWQRVLPALASFDHILIDTFGYSLKSTEEIGELKSLLPPDHLQTVNHLVLSATAKDIDLTEIGRRYSNIKISDLIFTRIDESVEHGAIYNFATRFQKPLHSFGIGPRIPEDFEDATRERLVDLIFKLSKQKSLEGEHSDSGVENAS
jgi:flagellar biosynthesis protein FlhF